ncbi:DegT/DnrJ/EryC1/StrS family aminotransferase [Candidatus Amesbacteria bacterium]|nr:DegT/DnrJ/EryC1/StrS family aminotransferase [Candidatus Amesbacteria bacterium]
MNSFREIAFSKPHIPGTTLGEIDKVLNSRWITTGPKSKEFEQGFCRLINAKNGVAVCSCTAALHLAYSVSNFKPGDEVIVPSFTFCSTINMLVHLGVKPVFCDILEESFCLDPVDIESRITPRTKAIVVVHFAGKPAPMKEITRIAKVNKLVIIEDAAHAFLTKYKGRYIGDSDNICCFSFYATKNLTTAEGGMITYKKKPLIDKIRMLSMHGISKHAWNRYSKSGTWKYKVLMPGYKYNITDIQSVIGLEQLKVALESRRKRLLLVNRYLEKLSSNKNLILPTNPSDKGSEHSWHLFTIRLKRTAKIDRDSLIEEMKKQGISTSVHFIPNHQQKFYRKTYSKELRLPVTEKVYKSILSLPLYEDLSISDVDYVASIVNGLV